MKKFNPIFRNLVCLLLCGFFLFQSCSNDNFIKETPKELNTYSKFQSRERTEVPANPANSYDYVGQLHNEILYSFYKQPPKKQNFISVMQRLDSIISKNDAFIDIAASGYTAPDSLKVNYILTHKIICATEVVARSGITLSAKSSLSNFISAVIALSVNEEDYEVIYSYIVSYESDVMLEPIFNTKDREVLLSVASVARYSTYAKRKRPKRNMDPDWDVLVSNIIGTVEGASENYATAVMYGLVLGILENRKL